MALHLKAAEDELRVAVTHPSPYQRHFVLAGDAASESARGSSTGKFSRHFYFAICFFGDESCWDRTDVPMMSPDDYHFVHFDMDKGGLSKVA